MQRGGHGVREVQHPHVREGVQRGHEQRDLHGDDPHVVQQRIVGGYGDECCGYDLLATTTATTARRSTRARASSWTSPRTPRRKR